MGTSRYMYTYLGIFDKIAEWIFGGISKAISWLFEKIFGPIFRAVLEPVADAILQMVKEACGSLFFMVFQALLRIVDVVQTAFMVFAGVTPVIYKGESKTLIEVLFLNSTVGKAFWGITCIAILLLGVFTLAAVSKKIADVGGEQKRSLGNIMSDMIKSFLGFMSVPAFCLAALLLSTAVLTASYEVTAGRGENGVTKTIATSLFEVTISSAVQDASKGSRDGKWDDYYSIFLAQKNPWEKSKADIGVSSDQYILCVDNYISLGNIDYVVGYFSAIFLIWNLIALSFQFVQRIFEVVLLYLVAPFFTALMPLDGGEKFKKWQGMFVAKLCSGLGMVIMVNLYLILVPLVMNNEINLAGGNVTTTENNAYNLLIKLLFLLGAALAIKNGGSLMTTLIDYQAGMSEQQGMMSSMAGMSMMANSALGGIKRFGAGRQARTAKRQERSSKRSGYSFSIKEKSYKNDMKRADRLDRTGHHGEAQSLRASADNKWNRTLNEYKEKGLIKRDPNDASKYSLTKSGASSGFGHSVDVANNRKGPLSLGYKAQQKWKKVNRWAAKVDLDNKDNVDIVKGRMSYIDHVLSIPSEVGKNISESFKAHKGIIAKTKESREEGIQEAKNLDRRPAGGQGAGIPEGRPAGSQGAGTPEGRPAGNAEQANLDRRPAGSAEAGTPEGRPAGNAEQANLDRRPAGSAEAGTPDEQPAGNGEQANLNSRPAGNTEAGTPEGGPAGNTEAGSPGEQPTGNGGAGES